MVREKWSARKIECGPRNTVAVQMIDCKRGFGRIRYILCIKRGSQSFKWVKRSTYEGHKGEIAIRSVA